MTAPRWLDGRQIAHRGLHDAANGIIENTPAAVAAAIAAGYAIEVDLQLSRDGEAMVFHDVTLERLTLASGRLSDRTAAQLATARFRGAPDARIVTLDSLLRQVDGQVPLVLEIKGGWKHVGPLESRIAGCLQDYAGTAAVMSFDPRSVGWFRTHAPGIRRGLVAGAFANGDTWPGLTRFQRFRLRHLLSAFTVRPEFIAFDVKALPTLATRLARLYGLPVLVWTVRSDDDRKRAERYGDVMIFEHIRPGTRHDG